MDLLTILIDNKVGSMAKVLRILASSDINILGLSTERGPLSEVRLILDKPQEAMDAFEKENIIPILDDVLVVKLVDKPGELFNISNLLEANNVNIDYIFGFGKKNDFGLVALKLSVSADEGRELLKDFVTM